MAMDPNKIEQSVPGDRPRARNRSPVDHATGLILRVCHIAGSASFVDDAREALAAEGVHAAVRNRDTAALFDWLVSILSYQGISDQVAFELPATCVGSQAARSSTATGIFTAADTTRPGTPAPSPITCRAARCPVIGCATDG
jgi:hypothetical protein